MPGSAMVGVYTTAECAVLRCAERFGRRFVQDSRPVRTRSVVENILLITVVACLGIGILRFAAVAATIPYAAYVNSRNPSQSTSIMRRVKRSAPFVSWWGGRGVPYREGGDYLGVVSKHQTIRSLGSVIGVLAEQARDEGAVINRVIVPADTVALYGEASGRVMTKADGTTVRTVWAPFPLDAASFTDILVSAETYDPLLTAGQAARLAATSNLVERSKSFFVAAPRAGGSGTWIVLARQGINSRQFLMVPIELSPVGGEL